MCLLLGPGLQKSLSWSGSDAASLETFLVLSLKQGLNVHISMYVGHWFADIYISVGADLFSTWADSSFVYLYNWSFINKIYLIKGNFASILSDWLPVLEASPSLPPLLCHNSGTKTTVTATCPRAAETWSEIYSCLSYPAKKHWPRSLVVFLWGCVCVCVCVCVCSGKNPVSSQGSSFSP